MNKLATSLTLTAVIIFDVSGTENIRADYLSANRNLVHSTSIATIENITDPVDIQDKCIDDTVIDITHHARSLTHSTTELGLSSVVITDHAKNMSQAFLDTVHDLKSGDIMGAIEDIHKIEEELDPELERACSSCIASTGGIFSSIKDTVKSIWKRIFGKKSSESDNSSKTTEESGESSSSTKPETAENIKEEDTSKND